MKKKIIKNKVTLSTIAESIDILAVSTKKGFDEVFKFRDEMYEFIDEMTEFKKKTETTLFNIDSKLETVDKRLDKIEKVLEPLMLTSTLMTREIRGLDIRVARLEQKAGIK